MGNIFVNVVANKEMQRFTFLNNDTVPIDEFVSDTLYNEYYGYYMTKVPFGKKGDYVTSSDISQLFGETIALWLLSYLGDISPPEKIILAELGPGNGTLMNDILRVMGNFPLYDRLLEVHLVEISPLLRELQEKTLDKAMSSREIFWHTDISGLPECPTIFVANEFFDALPVKQFALINGAWHENHVRRTERGKLEIVSIDTCRNFSKNSVPEGGIIEICDAATKVMKAIVSMLTRHGGAGVIVDYGYLQPVYRSTIQAVKDHHYCDFLSNVGECDISTCVDFNALLETAGDVAQEVITQREFLHRFGIRERLEMLLKNATEQQAKDLKNSYLRLTENMGTLFKVLLLKC